jgi:hypothetical protein
MRQAPQAIYAPVVRETAISFGGTADRGGAAADWGGGAAALIVCEHAQVSLPTPVRINCGRPIVVRRCPVYIQAQARRSGVGRGLYRSLFALLVLQGFYHAYAGITLPNPASVGLHESLGFVPVGVYRSVGYKLGAWHDVGWWQLTLQAHVIPPEPPVEFSTVRESAAWDAALANGLPCLRLS